MNMQVGVGFCDNPDSAIAGRLASRQALDAVGRNDICDIVLLFCTARHNQEILRQVVAWATGNSRCILGGGAAGVITNTEYGYAGDQVGIACIWLDGSDYFVETAGGLSEDEFDVGMRLGKKLAERGITAGAPVMLFYDAVNKTPGHYRLVMGTWLLEGMEKQLGFLPDFMGAGLQGDHICTPTLQFLGNTLDKDHAFTLSFSNDIDIDHVILHGCRPASPYYTVTKAEGPTILEIEGKPAIAFLDELFGSSITPDQYPFFLIFGINYCHSDEDCAEKHFASRLCQNIDKERGGIVMFQSDMVAGTVFQVMVRKSDLDYIRPQIENLLNGLEGKEPIFAFYINCAGRCAGYGGTDIEDAHIVQDIVQGRFPLFGLYAGVEIASVGGKAKSLNWTGIFCVLSKNNRFKRNGIKRGRTSDDITARSKKPKEISREQAEQLCIQNLANILAVDSRNIAMRTELEQKRRGFRLLAELSVSLRGISDREDAFFTVTRRINAVLNMQKTVLLFPGIKNKFVPFVLQGYTVEEKGRLAGLQLEIDARLLDMTNATLVTATSDESCFASLRETLNLPYFISTPIVVENEIHGILITGRMMEAPPFLSRLNENEVETVQAIAALLASIKMHQKLDEANRQASTDSLTELYNRGALERHVAKLLKQGFPGDAMSAFILIDLDRFKNINDSYGHTVGDQVLQSFARTLRNSLRSTDFVSRFGGDEFAAFCTPVREVKTIQARAEKLVEDWGTTPLYTVEGEVFHSTISIGISFAPCDGTTYDELLHKADIALYRRKEMGRNGCTIYDGRTMKKDPQPKSF